jgi:Fe-S-cluster containining protein
MTPIEIASISLTFAKIQTVSLSQKVQAVEDAFALLNQEMSDFKEWSSLSCLLGCGRCCQKPDIEATILEFLPFAYHLFLFNEAEKWLEKLENHTDPICVLFEANQLPGSGICTHYSYRGLICRLFGFSARLNKYGKREFVGCKPIKAEAPEAYAATVEKVANGASTPIMSHHYMRLFAIDPELSRKFYPINEAIRRAIETVLQYHHYRGDSRIPEPDAA